MIIENSFDLTGHSDCFYEYNEEYGLLKVHVQSCNTRLDPEDRDNWVETIYTKTLSSNLQYTKKELDDITIGVLKKHWVKIDWI